MDIAPFTLASWLKLSLCYKLKLNHQLEAACSISYQPVHTSEYDKKFIVNVKCYYNHLFTSHFFKIRNILSIITKSLQQFQPTEDIIIIILWVQVIAAASWTIVRVRRGCVNISVQFTWVRHLQQPCGPPQRKKNELLICQVCLAVTGDRSYFIDNLHVRNQPNNIAG